MEREANEPVGAQEALAVLGRSDDARTWLADRAASPRWYWPAMGLCFLYAFTTVSLGWESIPSGVIFGVSVVPTLLTMLVGHSTGISLDRFSATPGSRRVTAVLGVVLALLLAGGLTLEWGLDLRWSMAACGVLVLVATVLAGRRLDTLLVSHLRRPTAGPA